MRSTEKIETLLWGSAFAGPHIVFGVQNTPAISVVFGQGRQGCLYQYRL